MRSRYRFDSIHILFSIALLLLSCKEDSGRDGYADFSEDDASPGTDENPTDDDPPVNPDAWQGCADYYDCLYLCPDEKCATACAYNTTPEALDRWDNFLECLDEHCFDFTEETKAHNDCMWGDCEEQTFRCLKHRGRDPDYTEVGEDSNEVGETALNIYWYDNENQLHSFRDDFFKRKKAIVLEISAIWCESCFPAAANLFRLYKKYGADNLIVLDLLIDGSTKQVNPTTDEIKGWEAEQFEGLPLSGGPATRTWEQYIPDRDNFFIPFSVIIDPEDMAIKSVDDLNENILDEMILRGDAPIPFD